MNIEGIKEIFYSENGVFNRLRDGDYTISESEKEAVREFSQGFNQALSQNTVTTQEVATALDLVHTLPEYDEEEWTTVLANEIFEIMMSNIEYLD